MNKSACEVGSDKPGKKGCRTCVMGMLVSWWLDELNTKGYKNEATDLETIALDGTKSPEEVCALMETIPAKVDEPTKHRLNELIELFDHHATQIEKEED